MHIKTFVLGVGLTMGIISYFYVSRLAAKEGGFNRETLLIMSEEQFQTIKDKAQFYLTFGKEKIPKRAYLTNFDGEHSIVHLTISNSSDDDRELTCYRCCFKKYTENQCYSYRSVYGNAEWAVNCPNSKE